MIKILTQTPELYPIDSYITYFTVKYRIIAHEWTVIGTNLVCEVKNDNRPNITKSS